jgi:hypothetical protein
VCHSGVTGVSVRHGSVVGIGGFLSVILPSGGPATGPRDPEQLADPSIDGRPEEELGELILPPFVDTQLLDDVVREAKEVRTGNGVLELFDLLVDPLQVGTTQKPGGRRTRHGDNGDRRNGGWGMRTYSRAREANRGRGHDQDRR